MTVVALHTTHILYKFMSNHWILQIVIRLEDVISCKIDSAFISQRLDYVGAIFRDFRSRSFTKSLTYPTLRSTELDRQRYIGYIM